MYHFFRLREKKGGGVIAALSPECLLLAGTSRFPESCNALRIAQAGRLPSGAVQAVTVPAVCGMSEL